MRTDVYFLLWSVYLWWKRKLIGSNVCKQKNRMNESFEIKFINALYTFSSLNVIIIIKQR